VIVHGWSNQWHPRETLTDTTGNKIAPLRVVGAEPHGGCGHVGTTRRGREGAGAPEPTERRVPARAHGQGRRRSRCDGAGGSSRGGLASRTAREREVARGMACAGKGVLGRRAVCAGGCWLAGGR